MAVPIRELDCLDALIWFGTGEAASEKLCISQSSISRTARRAARTFHLDLIKGQGEWILIGDQKYLNLERRLHQRMRLDIGDPLRIETQFFYAKAFAQIIQTQHLQGTCNYLDIAKPIDLLRSHVIDVWIAGYPDLPRQDDPDLSCTYLTRHPLHLAVQETHPLLQMGDAITLDDVRQYPCIALRDGAFPETQRHLQSLGLWNTQVPVRRFNQEGWMEHAAERPAVSLASVFSIGLYEKPLVFLPVDLQFFTGQTFVVRREHENHPRIQALLASFKSGCVALAQQHPEVSIAFEHEQADPDGR